MEKTFEIWYQIKSFHTLYLGELFCLLRGGCETHVRTWCLSYMFRSVCKLMLSGGMVFIFNEIFILLVVSVGCVTAMIGQECRNVKCSPSCYSPERRAYYEAIFLLGACKKTGGC